MRAKFIYEKFEKESDPIKDMNIGLIKELRRIKDAIEEKTNMFWDDIELHEDTLIIEAENISILDTNHYLTRDYDWKSVGITSDFILEYYIDIIGEKNEIIRALVLRNPDIENFESWHKKTLSNNFLDMKDNEIAYLIESDYLGLETSDELYDGFSEAFVLAETEHEKTQKRIKN